MLTRAENPSGDAGSNEEYLLGSLPVGTRFVLYGATRDRDVYGTLVRANPCACLVQLERAQSVAAVAFEAVDDETGEKRDVVIQRGPTRTTWAYNTAVGVAEAVAAGEAATTL